MHWTEEEARWDTVARDLRGEEKEGARGLLDRSALGAAIGIVFGGGGRNELQLLLFKVTTIK